MTQAPQIETTEHLRRILGVDGVVTSFVIVAESADLAGGFSLHVATGDHPTWRSRGLLVEADAIIGAGDD